MTMKRGVNILGLTGSFPRHEDDHVGLHIATWAEALASKEHKVSIIAPSAPSAIDYELRDGIEITRVSPSRIWPQGHLWYRNGAPDNLRNDPWAWLEAIGFWQRIDRLSRPNPKPDLVWSHWAIPFGVLGRRLAERVRIKHIVQIHGSDLRMLERLPLGARIARYVRQNATTVICVTEEQRERFLRLTNQGDSTGSVIVLPIGVQVPPPMKPRASADRACRILVMSRLIKAKGVDLVIRAIKELTASAELRIVGEGVERPALEALTTALGVKAHFIGACSPKERWKNLAECDLLVHASRPTAQQIEGCPVVIGEAQSMSVPVVGTRVGGIPEALSDGAGLLVNSDVKSIASAIDSVLLSPSTRLQIVRQATRRITPLLWPNLIDSYCSVIKKSLA
jgi:glycosyltransferase involved in cell wall biosynthesis